MAAAHAARLKVLASPTLPYPQVLRSGQKCHIPAHAYRLHFFRSPPFTSVTSPTTLLLLFLFSSFSSIFPPTFLCCYFFSLVSSRAVFTEVFYWYKSIIFLCLFGVIPIGCTCLMSTRVDTVRPLEPRGRAWPRAVLRGASTGGGDAYAGLTLLLLRSAIMRTLTLVMNRDRLFLIVRSCCSHSQ